MAGQELSQPFQVTSEPLESLGFQPAGVTSIHPTMLGNETTHGKDKKSWVADPENIVAWVVEAIPELENALHNGTIETLLKRPDLAQKIGPVLYSRYTSLAEARMKHDHVFRQSWITVFLEIFRFSIQPPKKSFPAKTGKNQGGMRTLVVSHHQGDVTIREDQVLSARRWGIWFDVEPDELARKYSEQLIRAVIEKLDSNISSLRYVETTFLSGKSRLPSTAIYDHDSVGKDFEYLMQNVLNEFEQRSRCASLAEDLLERTDLRVSYPWLSRRNGARIQVSLVAKAEHHRQKFAALHLPDEFICLTPMDLALCAIFPPNVPLFEAFPWEELWAALGTKYNNEDELAQVLHDLFIDSLSFPRLHPLGPLWILPPPVRQFIRAFTEYCATEATGQIREREKTGPRFRGSVRKFTTGRWRTEFSDTSQK